MFLNERRNKMRLTWDIDHWSYHQAHEYVSGATIIYEIDYREATNDYIVSISFDWSTSVEPYEFQTYREAQIYCEWLSEWRCQSNERIKSIFRDILE